MLPSLHSALLHIKVVEALTGKHPDAIYRQVDGADASADSLVWVFDLSVRGGRGRNRDLRFLANEIIAPKHARTFNLARVLNLILPENRINFQSGDVERLLGISGDTLKRLRAAMGGRRNLNTTYYPRTALAAFLRARWLGAEAGNWDRKPVPAGQKPLQAPRVHQSSGAGERLQPHEDESFAN